MFNLIIVNSLIFLILLTNSLNCSNGTRMGRHPGKRNTTTATENQTSNCGELDLGESNYWPWLVKIRSRFGSKIVNCAGVLISPVNVLTAGHCVYSSADGFTGQVTVFLVVSKFKSIPVEAANMTYDHRLNGTSHNIALITLIKPVPVNYKPICLAISENLAVGTIAIGFNNNPNDTSTIVQQVNVSFKRYMICEDLRLLWLTKLPELTDDQRAAFTGYDMIDHTMLCGDDSIDDSYDINHTDRYNSIKSNCKHQPGEPLISKSLSNGKWYLMGIVSGTWFNHDNNDCDSFLPTIYTSALFYAHWIVYNCVDCSLTEI